LVDKPKTSKHSGGVIVSMPTWSVVDHGFQSLLDKPKTSKHSGGVIVCMPTWSVVDHGFQSLLDKPKTSKHSGGVIPMIYHTPGGHANYYTITVF
jgi:hypothetical protein